MKIVLAEERGGQQLSEQSFQQPVVRVGRDANDCQIVFDNQQYPMVSRKHAELQWQNGQWFLTDLNSSYGTFLNGQKISQPQAVQAGSALQFGTNGPVLRVVWFETVQPPQPQAPVYAPQPEPQKPISAPLPPQAPPEQQQQISNRQAASQSGSGSLDAPQLIFVGTSRLEPYKITKDSFWLGRDPNCDIVMEANAVMVSRKHAQISRQNGGFVVTDNGSFNGTLVNEQRISTPTPIYHGDEIQLGMGGPVLKFNSPNQAAPKGASLAGQRAVAASQQAVLQDLPDQPAGSKTMVFRGGNVSQQMKPDVSAQPQLLMQLTFGGKQELTIGREDNNDVKLDGLQISNRHARLLQTGGGVAIEDLNSTNGVYVNGQKISRQNISSADSVQIGSFVIRVDNAGNIGVFDTRSKTRIDSVNITKEVKDRSGGGTIKLLDGVSLTVMPNEFVGLLGPSGAGKSTFMDALNGMRPASGGSVLVNNLDLYQNLDALKQSIGYVPQDDIIHRELTVYRTLYYVAKLRLSTDVSRKEIDQIVNEVMDVTGLSERRDVPINQLSGGQRKRVSIAVELVTKPSVIYLDEPTSGLDPATEEKIMVLFRQIAESGRTVILTTHAMENVKLFDKIVLLMRGKLVFYGKPQEALEHVGAKSFKELYDKLEEPIEQRLGMNGANRHQVTEQVAEEWKQKFTKTPQYKKNVFEPLRQIGQVQSQGVQQKRKLGLFGAIRQWMTLSRRYWEVLVRDKFNLLILFMQAPIVAFLTFLVMDADQPRDFVYFVLSLVSVWFGTSVAAREIIREKAVYTRERMVNLGLMPYVFSKLFILGIIVGIQCLLLFLPLKFFDLIGVMRMPGELMGIPQFWVMLLTAGVGIALGLFISATVKTSEMATSLVPLILIPQILFSGLVGVPTGINKVAGLLMPATWSFDTMKRFSTLDTLKEEGADNSGQTRGVGYYKYVEQENDKLIADARKKIDDYKSKSEQKMKDYEKEMKDDLAAGQRPGDMPKLDAAPKIDDPKKIEKNLSAYVNFLHPWMNEVLNQIVLMIMFFILVIATLIVLRMQDIA
ncbi:MAG TPA: FHA domain-containing protein [Pyrinomonadaceae bacterium]|jgi:ABC-type multidrug transport system ATPase subunit/pSer/pThr/pTyr-binding forkhead associated (FHA) protein